MKKAISVLLSVLLIMLISGCRETPEDPIVNEKNNESFIKAAQQPQASAAQSPPDSVVAAPETFIVTLGKGMLHVIADATVTMPDSPMPIIRVEGADFSQDQVTALFNALCADTEMYTVPEQMTKSQLEQEIVHLKEQLARARNEGNTDDQQIYEDQIAKAEELIKTAPDTIEKVRSDGALVILDEVFGQTGEVVGHYTGINVSGGKKTFRVQNNSDRKEPISYVTEHGGGGILLKTGASIMYTDHTHNLSFGMGGKIPIDETTTAEEQPALSHMRTTPIEAKQMVEDFIRETGIPMMVKGMTLIDDERNDGGVYYPAENFAYEIDCARAVDDVSCAIVDGRATGGSSKQFAPVWFYEELTFRVNDDGIVSMDWISPLRVIDTVVESSRLLPFSDIRAVFEKMMPIVYEYEANQTKLGDTTIRISDVELELVRTSEQNSINTGLLIPAWRFYGTKEQPDQTGDGCWLTVNAVDGSIIDTDIGY